MPSRPHVISFRLTGEEKAKGDFLSIIEGRRLADWCRATCLQEMDIEAPAPVKAKLNPPRKLPTYDKQLLARISGELGKIGSNVNQIARISNASKKTPETARLVMMQQDILTMKQSIETALRGGVYDH